MRERVDDMEAVKKMVESLSRHEDEEAEVAKQGEPSTNTELTMQELLARSEELLSEIRAASDDVLEEKLSALAESSDTTEQDETAKTPKALEEPTEEPTPAAAEIPEENLSDEELVQAVTKNQLEARELLGKIMRSEAVKQQGNSANNQGLDTSNPLAVEDYFSGMAQGSIQDVSQAMKMLSSARTGEASAIDASAEEKPLSAPHINQRQKLVFSRKLTGSGEKAEWVVLNAWYFIGPFPNPGRENIHTRFPPEISIDLNALYIGDSNRLLKWQYIQFDHLPVIPPDFTDYAVYYAYTQVFSEQAQDVWLAIGSDDQSKLWVNDMLVWQSTDQERVWTLAQGYRKVHLRPGNNKFLFRLENGIERAAFSVALAPAS